MKSRVPNPCPAKSGPSPEISGPSPENSGPDFFKIFVKQVIFMMTSWNHAIMQIPPTFHRRHQGLLYIIKLQYPSSCINSWTPGILKYITCLLHHWYQFTVTFSFRGIQIILEHPGMNCRRVFYELDQVFLKNTHQLHSPMFHAQPVSTTSRKFLHGSVFGLERFSDPRLQMFFALTEICHMIPGPTTSWTHKSRLVGMKALQPAGILSLFEPRAYLMTFTKSASKFQAFDSSHHPISAKRLCKGSGDTCPKWRTPHFFPISYFHVWHQHTRKRIIGHLVFN